MKFLGSGCYFALGIFFFFCRVKKLPPFLPIFTQSFRSTTSIYVGLRCFTTARSPSSGEARFGPEDSSGHGLVGDIGGRGTVESDKGYKTLRNDDSTATRCLPRPEATPAGGARPASSPWRRP